MDKTAERIQGITEFQHNYLNAKIPCAALIILIRLQTGVLILTLEQICAINCCNIITQVRDLHYLV